MATRHVAAVLFGFVMSLGAADNLRAQSGSATISGIVRDGSQGVIPQVLVLVVNENTGVAIEVLTNDDGVYRAAALVPGRYRVEVNLSGFDPARRTVDLALGETRAIDIVLDVQGLTDTVSVVARVPLLESQTSQVTQTVTREMLDVLPIPNRAASSLAALAPGVVMIDTGTGTAENYPVFSAAGGRVRNQSFILDGGNATNAVGLTRPQQLTSLPGDAMQEFKVITNNYSAEYGHSTGGVVSMSTRSGTNAFRSTAFESMRHDALDAKNYFAASKPKIRLHQFGGTSGGPIVRNRSFFFGTWERTRQETSDTLLSTVPTLANRQGDFSDLVTNTGERVPIYDPQTGLPFPGNVIPRDRIDPVALAAIQYYPAPNRTGTATNANNFVGNSPATLDRDIVVARLDHQLRLNDLLTVRYYLNDSGTYAAGSYGNPVADPLADITDVRVQSLTGALTHIFTSSLVAETRVTYLRRKFIDMRPGLGTGLAAAIGLGNVSDQGFPAFAIAGYSGLSNSSVSRIQTPILDTQVLNSLSWNRGTHAVKTGVEFRAGANDEVRDRGSSGSLAFSPLITSNRGLADTGNALASFLLGEVTSASVQISDLIRTRASYWAFFAQDDWRITDRLTVNLGLRWETELPRREVDNKMNSFDPVAINPVSGTPGVVTFAGRDGVPVRAFSPDLNNFGPRAGFAYSFNNNRTVVRGGTGIFHGSTVSNTIGDTAALGFSTSANFVVAQATTQSAFRLREGVPGYARPPLTSGLGAVQVGERPNTAVAFFDPRQQAPISYQSNIGIQHEFGPDLVVEVGYMGNISHHLTGNDFSINQLAPEFMGPGDTQRLRPFPQFSNVTLINPSIGNSSYHAGFVRVQKRLASGFSVLAHYTRSRFMDDAESSNEYGAPGSYMDAYHRELDWGPSGSDVPHHFVMTTLYEVPRLGGHPLLNAILGNWRVGAVMTLQSGAPFTVITAANTTNAFSAGALRPNLLHDPVLPAHERTLTRWFDTSAFAAPAPFTFGNSPRSVLRGPGLSTVDMMLEKTFGLTERARVDLRVEAFNVTNVVNFNLPGAVLGSPEFGAISSARPGRTVQLGARLRF